MLRCGLITLICLNRMTDSHSDIDYVDYTSLSFPSDRLTFGVVRRVHPDLIDVDDTAHVLDKLRSGTSIGDMIYLERLLARQAFETAIGKTEKVLPQSYVSREECIDDLNKAYVQYGLSTGRHETEQLIRDFETQAVRQAPNRPGPP
jgi:hypothetical protein